MKLEPLKNLALFPAGLRLVLLASVLLGAADASGAEPRLRLFIETDPAGDPMGLGRGSVEGRIEKTGVSQWFRHILLRCRKGVSQWFCQILLRG